MALPAMMIDGDVVAVHSHWTADRSRIVTEATVRTADGSEVVVSQLGGRVDGIGMITMPGPPMLEPGMKVAVAAHRAVDSAQREHVVLDSARVLSYPSGFVRTGPTKAGRSLYWESACVFVTVDSSGTTALAGDQEFPIIDASIATWNDDTASCSYLKVISEARASVEVGNDKLNVIKFRDTVWGRPAVGDDPARMYSSAAAGITTAVYIDDESSARDGAIIDADIELNGVHFAISDNGQSLGKGTISELQNTLTHELGHLHGLEHPCLAGGDPPRVDNLGNPVPQCGPLNPPAITEATMYNFQSEGETKKETLSPDDIQAICAIYPTASDPGSCEPVGTTSGGCCSASDATGGRPDAAFLLTGATMLLLLRRRRTSAAASRA